MLTPSRHPADGRCALSEPSLEYEQALRQTRRDTDELWRYLRRQLAEVAAQAPAAGRLRTIAADTQHRYAWVNAVSTAWCRSLLSELDECVCF